MFCPKCGAPAPENAGFCASCGNKLSVSKTVCPQDTNSAGAPADAVALERKLSQYSVRFSGVPDLKSKKPLLYLISGGVALIAMIAAMCKTETVNFFGISVAGPMGGAGEVFTILFALICLAACTCKLFFSFRKPLWNQIVGLTAFGSASLGFLTFLLAFIVEAADWEGSMHLTFGGWLCLIMFAAAIVATLLCVLQEKDFVFKRKE